MVFVSWVVVLTRVIWMYGGHLTFNLQFFGVDTISYPPQLIFDVCSLYTLTTITVIVQGLRLALSNGSN
jgi:hypothetical protein